MSRFVIGVVALVSFMLPAFGDMSPMSRTEDARSLPMRFALVREGPADACRDRCRTWVSAIGAITPETPREFEKFIQANDVRGATMVLDSGGGSVIGALALGRAVRRMEMRTTVGRTVQLRSPEREEVRASISPRTDCESMCAFVLLAGVQRTIPSEARVLVHQIWLGNKRDDATAVTYTAEDLAVVQRDVGRLAQYTIEMGGSIDLLETALRIPPWESLRPLTRDELRRMRLDLVEPAPAPAQLDAIATPPASKVSVGGGTSGVSERGWSVVEKAGHRMLARNHPLTMEGEEIGSFDLMFACGETAGAYKVAYAERRAIANDAGEAERIKDITIAIGQDMRPLTIESSAPAAAGELASFAQGQVPASVLNAFAGGRSRAVTIFTQSLRNTHTAIRVGNIGFADNLKRLAQLCAR